MATPISLNISLQFTTPVQDVLDASVAVPITGTISCFNGFSVNEYTPTGGGTVLSLPVTVSDTAAIGGQFQALPSPTVNGTLVTPGPNGIRLHLPSGSSVSFTKAASQPIVAPTMVDSLTGVSNGPIYDINVNPAIANVYLTASSGGAFYEQI
jgi:hypothetical protein